VRLYNDADIHDLGAAAHARRHAAVSTNVVTYVIDTTINYTNVCNVHCTFCAFFRPENHKEGYTIVARHRAGARSKYAADQGGDADHDSRRRESELASTGFETLFDRVRREYPDVDIHSLSVSEIVGLAHVEQIGIHDVLFCLKAGGHESLPGAGAEILVERVRKRISARKVKPHEWLDVHAGCADIGHADDLATMMFGSIETAEERIRAHARVCASCKTKTRIQRPSFPWYYVPFKTPPARPRGKPVWSTCGVLAVSRLYLDNFPHLQASWLTPGLEDGPDGALLRLRTTWAATIIEERVVPRLPAARTKPRAAILESLHRQGRLLRR